VDDKLTDRVRAALSLKHSVQEVKMFGGIGFMLNGNLVACASTRGVLVRVGEIRHAWALEHGAKPMIMNGRQMKGFVWVDPALRTAALSSWLREACAFVDTLPAKVKGKKVAGKSASKKAPGKAPAASAVARRKRGAS
jgi:hypothetical protein